MFAILSLELPVIPRMPRWAVERQDFPLVEKAQDLRSALARNPIEPHHERRPVGLEVDAERLDDAGRVVGARGRHRRPVGHRRVRGDKPVRHPFSGRDVHCIEATDEPRRDDRDSGAASATLVLHFAELALLDRGARAAREMALSTEMLCADQTVCATYDRLHPLARGSVDRSRHALAPGAVVAIATNRRW